MHHLELTITMSSWRSGFLLFRKFTVGGLQPPVTLVPGDPMTSSGLSRYLHTCAHTYIQVITHTHQVLKKYDFNIALFIYMNIPCVCAKK